MFFVIQLADQSPDHHHCHLEIQAHVLRVIGDGDAASRKHAAVATSSTGDSGHKRSPHPSQGLHANRQLSGKAPKSARSSKILGSPMKRNCTQCTRSSPAMTRRPYKNQSGGLATQPQPRSERESPIQLPMETLATSLRANGSPCSPCMIHDSISPSPALRQRPRPGNATNPLSI